MFLAADMLLENPAFGTSVRGLPENERALTRWFKFPDYHVVLAGNNADTLICWGKVRMTMTGAQLGVVPNGRRVELPVHIQFTFEDDRIASERFFFDLSERCAQSGVSTDLVRQKLFGSAHAPAA